MKKYDLCGIGHCIVDVLVNVTTQQFEALAIPAGTTCLVEAQAQKQLLAELKTAPSGVVSGGSAANSVIAAAQLGGKASFVGVVGDDEYGLFCKKEFEELGIDIGDPVIKGELTGTCLSLVTPDAERTMRVSLGVSSSIGIQHIAEERVATAQWLMLEGYLFSDSEATVGAVFEAIRMCKRHKGKLALSSSAAYILEVFGKPFGEALKKTDLLFTNDVEAAILTGKKEPAQALEKLKEMVPAAIVTAGADGAYVHFDGTTFHTPAYLCKPIDTTGAGDMFAGAFLYGITNGSTAEDSARGACYLSSKVITQMGARISRGTPDFWREVVKQPKMP